jgi:hypothetical protein
MPSSYWHGTNGPDFDDDYDGDAIASHMAAEEQREQRYSIGGHTRILSNSEQLRAARAAERAREHNATQVRPRSNDQVAVPGGAEQVEALLRQFNAYPVKTNPEDMTEVERALAAVQGLSAVAAAAAASLAAAQQRENERGPEPPVGSTVRFAKHYTSKADGKQYAFSAISVEKEHGQRRWHHSGNAQFSGGLHNPCSWEELNEFADDGSVEVGTTWVAGPSWPESVVSAQGEPTVGSSDAEQDRRAARYAEELNGVLYQAVQQARDVLAPAAATGTAIPKWRVRDAHNALTAALNEHATQQARMTRETEGAE